MGRPEQELEKIRTLRDAAQAVFQDDLDIIKAELAPKALSARVKDKAGQTVGPAARKASDIAHENRTSLIGGIVAITAGTGLWLARKPLSTIFAAVRRRLEGSIEGAPTNGSKDQ